MADGIYSFEGHVPDVAPDAFIAHTAAVIGRVAIGAQSSVWFHTVLRGDTCFIRVGARTNIQDGCIVHITGETMPTIIGDDVTIGHAAILHACTIEDHAFVGMGATVLDGAVVEQGGVLAAGALLTPNKRLGRHELWAGSPARKVRTMEPDEQAHFAQNAAHYVVLAQRMRAGLRAL